MQYALFFFGILSNSSFNIRILSLFCLRNLTRCASGYHGYWSALLIILLFFDVENIRHTTSMRYPFSNYAIMQKIIGRWCRYLGSTAETSKVRYAKSLPTEYFKDNQQTMMKHLYIVLIYLYLYRLGKRSFWLYNKIITLMWHISAFY